MKTFRVNMRHTRNRTASVTMIRSPTSLATVVSGVFLSRLVLPRPIVRSSATMGSGPLVKHLLRFSITREEGFTLLFRVLLRLRGARGRRRSPLYALYFDAKEFDSGKPV